MARARSGDPDAFAALYERHRNSVLRQCHARLRDHALAEEATQETFTRLLAALPRFQDRGQLPNYLSRVARFVCLDLIADRGLDRVPIDEASEARDPVDVEHVCERRHSVEMVLRGLTQRDAALLRAKHLHDRPTPDIAQEFGLTTGSAAVLLTRARTSARRLAHRQGLLHGLWPVPALGGLLRRLLPTQASSAARFAAPPLAGLLVLGGLLVPALPGDARQPQAAMEYREAGSGQDAATTTNEPTRAAATRDGATTGAAPRPLPAAQPSPPAVLRPPRRALVPLPAEVALPVLGRRVHQQAPADPDVEYGVRIGSGPNEVHAAVEAKDEHTADPAHGAACTATTSSPVTYCNRRR